MFSSVLSFGLLVQLCLFSSANSGPVERVLTATNVCFSAEEGGIADDFNPPKDGTITGFELEFVSGGDVNCRTNGVPTNWGCDADLIAVTLFRDDIELLYPQSTAVDLVPGSYDFMPASQCSVVGVTECVQSYQLNGVTSTDPVLTVLDTERFDVETTDVLNLRNCEGYCSFASSDNEGETCANVYLFYVVPTEEPSNEPTEEPAPVLP